VHDAAVAALRELAAGRADLLAEVAGLMGGFSEGEPDEPRTRRAAMLCREAGADTEAIRSFAADNAFLTGTPKSVPRTDQNSDESPADGPTLSGDVLGRQVARSLPRYLAGMAGRDPTGILRSKVRA
jgi:hypothetical protein